MGPNGRRSTPVRTSLTAFNWNVAIRAVFETVCSVQGFVFVSFALSLGISKEALGLVTFWASLTCLFQLFGLVLMNRVARRKTLVLRLLVAEPLVLCVLIPLVPHLPAAARFPAVCAAVFIASSVLQLTRPTTDEWLASVIPGSIRGRYLGRRIQIVSVTAIVSMVVVGHISERIPRTDTRSFALLLAAGAVFGLVAVAALARADMPAVSATDSFRLADVRGLWRARPFLHCLLAVFLYNVPFWIGIPYYQVFYLRVLHMREGAIAWMLGGYFLLKILLSPALGRVYNRIGARAMFLLVTPLYLYFFLSFTISTPERPWPLWLGWFVVGLADAGFGVAATAWLYEAIPASGSRKSYFTIYNMMSFAAAALFSRAAVGLAETLKGAVWSVGGRTLGQFHIFYLICFALLAALGLSIGVLAPGKKR